MHWNCSGLSNYEEVLAWLRPLSMDVVILSEAHWGLEQFLDLAQWQL